MNKDSIRYLVIGDIHLGHPRNKTEDILKALDVFFNHYKPRSDLDILFLAGDVFDRLLDFPTPDVAEVTTWVHRLTEYCGRNHIKLRVLEGTPSHDWGQSKIFNTVFKVSGVSVDVRYVNTLSIEYMEDLDIHVLYVPDEWNTSTDKTFEQVKEQLAIAGIQQVDIACMHGMFNFQAPPQAHKSPKHDEQSYLSVVKYFISIGHVHTSKVYERILGEGSFDRLSHGEEEPKGGMECVIHRDGRGEHFFIENKLAKRFVTYSLKSKDLDECVAYLERKTRSLPTDSYVRIRARKDHPVIVGFDELKRRFPMFVMSKITLEEEEEINHQLVDDATMDETYVPITITQDNIKGLLLDELNARHALTSSQLAVYDRIMEDVI